MTGPYQDLLKDSSKSFEDGNYFLVTITDLNPNTTYPLEFRWTYKDERKNDAWSAVKLLTTPGESQPNTPKFTSGNVNVLNPEKLIITWDGTSDDNTVLENYERIDVYIGGDPFDSSKPAYSFKAPGTYPISAPAGTYTVALYAVSKTGKISPVSSSVTKTVLPTVAPVTSPETPDAPVVKAGLASVIVEWNGKKSGGTDLTKTGFAGAKVYIGTTSGFTPSDNNWVHTLNFANGSNRVSIGVGSVIDKSTGATLQYGVPYYIKLDTINASGTSNNNPVAASGNPITVSKLPASEISTGILSADASITAGIDGGSRVVMSGGPSPFIIYGTDGTTKLLEFIGGSTGTLAINGSGTFTGNLSIGSGNDIFKAEPTKGIWLGNSTWANSGDAPFSVSKNGNLYARVGTVGGWTLDSTYLRNSSDTFRLQSAAGTGKYNLTGLVVGSTSSPYFTIEPTAITHRNADGTASGKFTLDIANSQLTISGNITVTGGNAATSTDLAGKVSNGQVANDSSFTANNIVYKINGNTNTTTIDGGKITTGTIAAGSIAAGQLAAGVVYAGNISANQINAGIITGIEINNGSGTFKVTSNGDVTATSGTFTGEIRANSGYIGSTSGWNFSSSGYIYSSNGTSIGTTFIYPSPVNNYSAIMSGKIVADKGFAANGREFTPSIANGVNSWQSNTTFMTDSGSLGASLGTTSWRWNTVYLLSSPVVSSDINLKTSIETSDLGLNFINNLNPVSYKFKKSKALGNIDPKTGKFIITQEIPGIRYHYGFIAQEVKAVLDKINYSKDFAGWALEDPEDPNSTQSLRYEEFISPIVKAIQEISSKLNLIESRLDALEA